MPDSSDNHTGARIGDYRKLRHLTQHGLAQRAHLGRGTIAKVEAGLTPATPAVVAAVARALEVEPPVLTGQPYMEEMQQDRLDRMIAPLAEALDMYDLTPDPEITPRSLDELEAEVSRLCAASCATQYRDVGRQLPGLLGELTTLVMAASGGGERRRGARSLSWCYWAGYEFAYRLGYHHLAAIALERMGWTAEQAQDPLMLAVRLSRRSAMLLRRGEHHMASRVLVRGHQLIEEHEEPQGDSALAVSGSLHLADAIAAAQAQESSVVDVHIAHAREAAERIGRDVPSLYWASFGPTNVCHFDVATAVELGRLDDAAKAAKALRFPDAHPRMRVGRFHIEMGRAYAQMGQYETAERELHRARAVAPQQARYHPMVRSTIGVLVRRQRRVSEGLAALSRWTGVMAE